MSRDLSHILRNVRPEQADRATPSSPVLQSHGVTTHIPDTAHTGLRALSLFETLDSTQEVIDWLRLLGLDRYSPAFEANGVTGRVLLGLTDVELRDVLNVTRLKDRRILRDGICYLEEALMGGGKGGYPEDGRILTHLSNERNALLWIRQSIVAQTIAIASLFLIEETLPSHIRRNVLGVSLALSIAGIVALLYGVYRFFRMASMIDSRGESFTPDYVPLFLPCTLLIMGALIFVYIHLSPRAGLPDTIGPDAAMLLLLMV